MTVLLAVLAVGVGSLAFRALPLLGSRHIPDRLTEVAGWSGLAVIAAIVVRSVLRHEHSGVPAAPLVAAIAVGIGLLLAFRGRSVLVAVGSGGSTYLVLSAALAALT